MEGSTELGKLCKGFFVAERQRRTGLRPIVTSILSSLIPVNVVGCTQILKLLRIATLDAVNC